MLRSLLNLFFLLFAVSSILFSNPVHAAERHVRVGVRDNAPFVFQDEKGIFRGFSVEILEYVAEKENWELEYVHGTWAESLDRLERGAIDVLSHIAYSRERALKFDFTRETLLSNWGIVYSKPGIGIETIPDLEGKRVALIKKAIHAKAFKKLANDFSIHIEVIEVDNPQDGFQLVSTNKADAVVTHRVSGLHHEKHHDVERTNIIFHPIEIRYAMPKGKNSDLIAAIDQHLKKLKADKNSVFYQAFNASMELGKTVTIIPKWVYWISALAIVIIGFLLFFNRILTSRINMRTKDLQESENKYRLVVENQTDMMVTFNLEGELLYVSPSYCKTFGKSQEELIGKQFMPLIHEEDRGKVEDAIKEVHKPPYNVSVEHRSMTTDG